MNYSPFVSCHHCGDVMYESLSYLGLKWKHCQLGAVKGFEHLRNGASSKCDQGFSPSLLTDMSASLFSEQRKFQLQSRKLAKTLELEKNLT